VIQEGLSRREKVLAAISLSSSGSVSATPADARQESANTGDKIANPGEVDAAMVIGNERENDETDAISITDTVMSVEGSSSGGSCSHSTCGSSVSASGTRKRAADGSPEREGERNLRRDFLGRVFRSVAGCRVYLPPLGDGSVDCLGRILNDIGTIVEKITVGRRICDN